MYEFWLVDSNGKLIRQATEDEVKSGAKTVKVERKDDGSVSIVREIAAPAILKNDPMEKLAGIIKDMSVAMKGSVDSINDRVAKIEEQVSAYKEYSQKFGPGLFVPPTETPQGGDDIQKCVRWDMAVQGKRLMDKFHHPGHTIDEPARKEMANFFCLLLEATTPNDFGGFNPRAQQKMVELYGRRAITKTGTTQVGDSGNAWVIPDIVEAEIFFFQREASIILRNARIWDMTSEKQSWPRETSGVSLGWGNTTAESDPVAEEFELDCEELSAYSAVRRTTLADSRSDIVSWIAGIMAEASGQELDNKAFNGLGTDDPFICSGILSAACGLSVVFGAGSTAFSSMTADNLSDMIGKLDGLRKEGAAFWMNGAVIHYVRTLKDNNGTPIFQQTVGQNVPGLIWGYPYYEVIKCPSTSAANTAFAAFGNMRYFAVGRRLGSTALDVNPYLLWTTNRIAYKIYQRWALGMNLPNGFVRLMTHS